MGLLDLWNKPNDNIEALITRAINENKTIRISYQNNDGEASVRTLSQIRFNNEFQNDGFFNAHIKAFCHLRQEERTFKISRIIKAEII
ncbi:WYL domain-containing protein [Flavobacterium algicola]|uniref:WYL domain-containing protein n=1 Tax=Flavobacterium algicola TaxID=556529 RepID=UPI001EFE6828|nr:WYL domain-containing protein [Flavobacterium algicola]MCG9793312.1 WYL domain-containing protein [Flavobacterium algicola]